MPLAEVEVFFVDDESSDDSIERARMWSERLPCHSFEIIELPRCGKPGPVRNRGLEQATGELLLCLDPDDTLHPDYLLTCVQTLDANPDVDLVYTDYCERSADGLRNVQLLDFNQGVLRTQNALSPAAMYRRSLWDSGVRYLDNTEYEDWDYWIQCQMAGARFLRIPQILYTYEIHDTNYSNIAVKNDGNAKAVIVMNNLEFFHPLVQEWASGHLRNRLHSLTLQRGYIPRPTDVRELLKEVEQRVLKLGKPS